MSSSSKLGQQARPSWANALTAAFEMENVNAFSGTTTPASYQHVGQNPRLVAGNRAGLAGGAGASGQGSAMVFNPAAGLTSADAVGAALQGLVLAPSFTISADVRFADRGSWARIFDMADAAAKNDFMITRYGTSDKVSVHAYDQNGNIIFHIISSQDVLAPGVQRNVTVTYDAPSLTVKLYVDGQEAGSATSSAPLTPGKTAYVGRSFFANDAAFRGTIDDLVFANRALTGNEVKDLSATQGGFSELATWKNALLVAFEMDNVNGINGWVTPSSYRKPGQVAGLQAASFAGISSGNSFTGQGSAMVFNPDVRYTSADRVGAIMPNLVLTPSFTISADVRFADRGAWARIFEAADAAGVNDFVICRDGTSDRVLVRGLDKNSNILFNIVSNQNVLAPGVQRNVTVTYDAPSLSVKLYVDGQEAGSATSSAPLTPGKTAYVGRSFWGVDAAFRGAIDDLALFDRALSPVDVQDLSARQGGFAAYGPTTWKSALTAVFEMENVNTVAGTDTPASYQLQGQDVRLVAGSKAGISSGSAIVRGQGFGMEFNPAAGLTSADAVGATLQGLVLAPSFTISADVRFADRGAWGRIFEAADEAGVNDFVICRDGTSDRVLVRGLDKNSNILFNIVSNQDVLTPGVQRNVTVTYDAPSLSVKLYVDGQEAGSATSSAPLTPGKTAYVGRSFWWVDAAFRGTIDDLVFANRALTSDEVKDLAGMRGGFSNWDVTRHFSVDVAADSDTGVSDSDGVTADDTPTVKGTGVVGATVTITDGANGPVVATTRVIGNGTWSVETSVLSQGTHHLFVQQTDEWGTTGAPKAEVLAMSRGYEDGQAGGLLPVAGIKVGDSFYGGSIGLRVVVTDTSGAVVFTKEYNTYSNAADAKLLAQDLGRVAVGNTVYMTSADTWAEQIKSTPEAKSMLVAMGVPESIVQNAAFRSSLIMKSTKLASGWDADYVNYQGRGATTPLSMYGDADIQTVYVATNWGDESAQASNLGLLGDKVVKKVGDSVGSDDLVDHYRFNLDVPGRIYMRLDGKNVGLSLLDSTGKVVREVPNDSNADVFDYDECSPGTYYAKVTYDQDAGVPVTPQNNYNLTLVGGAVNSTNRFYDHRRDDTFDTATDISRYFTKNARPAGVEKTGWITGSIGKEDTVDYYRFILDKKSAIEVNLALLKLDAGLSLLDANGKVLASSDKPGTQEEQIKFGSLDAGTYYVAVTAKDLTVSAGWSDYHLSYDSRVL